MTIATTLKSLSRIELASLAFFAASGLILIVFLPLTAFAPQLGLLGVLSLIVAYGLFTKRGWEPWLQFILLVSAMTFSFYTLFVVGFSNALVGISMITYAALSLIFAFYILLKK